MHATPTPAPTAAAQLRPSWWWGFALYAVVSAVHIVALAVGVDEVAGPTKLALMPALAIAAMWAGRGGPSTRAHQLLYIAIALSWLGDGAGTFFPFADDELPMMLLCFGLAHIAYIVLFLRFLAERRFPAWSLAYVAWWIVLVLVLWPHLGALAFPVAIYGLVLGGTAAASARSTAVVASGGALFLASDTVLAFRIFLPDAMPDWTSPLVMLTYCAGQGLIVLGAIVALRRRTTR